MVGFILTALFKKMGILPSNSLFQDTEKDSDSLMSQPPFGPMSVTREKRTVVNGVVSGMPILPVGWGGLAGQQATMIEPR